MNPSADSLNSLESRLRADLEGEVLADSYHLALYATDASIYQIQPLAVVLPKHARDVERTIRIAAELNTPIVPRGSGTSLSGQSVGRGIVLDFSKYMNHILEIDPAAGLARIEPGVVLDDLNAAAAPYGLQFGPDVATSNRANLGGMIGNNSAGSRSIVFGKTVDHVLSLDVVLADGSRTRLGPWTPHEWSMRKNEPGIIGAACKALDSILDREREEIVARYPAVQRRVSGYNFDEFVPACRDRLPVPPNVALARRRERDRYPAADRNLAKLIVGSEGTLAVVVEATVQLVPRPAQRGLAVLEFDSLDSALATVPQILTHAPSAIELFDKLILELAKNSLEYRNYLDFVTGTPESLILVEVSGDLPGEIHERLEMLTVALKGARGLTHAMTTADRQVCDHVWACRKAALPLLMSVPGTRKPIAFVEDTAVPPARLLEFAQRFRAMLEEEGTRGAFYGHASVGVLHIRPFIDTAAREDIDRFNRILERVSDLVLEFGGAMSGEHGDGLARSFLNEKLFGPRIHRAMQEIKHAFDPSRLLNPGKVVEGPPPDENLRHSPEQMVAAPPTAFDFSSQGGFAGAASMCNGAGVCRKLHGGTMCPSFMVTRDEEHSTRGRANALRLVLTGALPPQELTGERLYQTYDLCLQCKACKAECPSNVDVAKLKAEFLYRYRQQHGTPSHVKRLGNVAWLNRWGSRLAPVSNWFNHLPGAAWFRQQFLGIDRRRTPPTFHRQHFSTWFRARPKPHADPPRGRIVLLNDCLTSYLDPAVPQAAVEVLSAAGYEVVLANLPCCGRALISQGLLDEAKQLAKQNVERLLPFAEKGLFIIGVEPSCLLTLCDDYLDLVPGDAARKVAAQSRLIDTHLTQIKPKLNLKLRPQSKTILLHAHCHQKALVGQDDTRQMLQMIPDVQVRVLDAGCCGMAGSFGYTHYDLSMKIGERVLFPAVREFEGEAVAAPGFSCRCQIADGTDRLPTHPIQHIARQLERTSES